MQKRKAIILSSTLGALVLGGIFAAYALNKDSDNTQTAITGNNLEYYEKYVNKYLYTDNSSLNIFKDGLSEEAKLYITWNNFKPTNWSSFSYDDINEVYKSLFEGDLPRGNIENNKYCMPLYDYNKSKQEFESRPVLGGCGGIDPTPRYSTISKVQDYGNEFIIEVSFGKGEADPNTPYDKPSSEYSLELNDGETIKIICDYTDCDYEFESRYSKLKKYYFVFTKRDNDFVLKEFSSSYTNNIAREPYTISFSRHPISWYKANTKKQIVTDDNYNTFESEINNKYMLYLAINGAGSYYSDQNQIIDYLRMNDEYEEITGDYLKKQDYSVDSCYELKYYEKEALYSSYYGYTEAGGFINTKYNEKNWSKTCGNKKSNAVRIYDIEEVQETDTGYKAKVKYLEAIVKADKESSEVWYELKTVNDTARIDCGYDKNSCKSEKVQKYFDENRSNIKTYEITFETNKERETIKAVSEIDQANG